MIRRIKCLVKRTLISIFKVCTGCTLLYKTNWYKSFFVDMDHEIYPDNEWYRNHEERNFDIVNLGSLSAKYAFNYTDFNIKALNWAQPQTLPEDYQILRHYHSILKKGGYVIITIMPFTGVNKRTGIRDAMKYLKLNTAGTPIQPIMYNEAKKYAEFPILFGKPAFRALISNSFAMGVVKKLLGKKTKKSIDVDKLGYNPMNSEQLKADAEKWMGNWKIQFSITDFESALTDENKKGREYRINVMRDLIDFCLERDYVPVYVIPPVTEYLSALFTKKFKDIYIYDYLKEVNRNILCLDYLSKAEWKDKDFYFNSFFLNSRGARLFTQKVLEDIGLLKS